MKNFTNSIDEHPGLYVELVQSGCYFEVFPRDGALATLVLAGHQASVKRGRREVVKGTTMRSPRVHNKETKNTMARKSAGKSQPPTEAVKLLTPAEEFELVSQLSKLREKIQRLLQPMLEQAPEGVRLNHFDQMVAYYQEMETKLPRGQSADINRRLAKYNEIKHSLVLANLPWVTRLARAQRHSAIAEEDLFQEGVCGLLKAIDRFEAERGLRLMTYATWYIREAMQQIRARQSHLVSISSHDQTLLGQLEARQSEFQHRNERLPTTDELGKSLHGNPRQLSLLQMATRPAVSLERGGTEGAIPVAVEDPIPEFDRKEEVREAVARLLDSLPMRERLIVTRRFGLDGQEPTSLEVLGDDLQVSKERVRQLQRQAIRRMQQVASEEQLEVLTV